MAKPGFKPVPVILEHEAGIGLRHQSGCSIPSDREIGQASLATGRTLPAGCCAKGQGQGTGSVAPKPVS